MTDLFIKLVNMSLSAGWLVLVLCLLRLLLKKMPKNLRLLLWGLVALRLLCPFSLKSGLSLIPSEAVIPEDFAYREAPEISSGIRWLDEAVNPALEETFSAAGTARRPAELLTFAAAGIWLTGAAVLLLRTGSQLAKTRRMLRSAVSAEEQVLESDAVTAPFIFGYFRPCIVLPAGMPPQQRQQVLAHEREHLRRKDHLWKLLAYGLLIVYWMNPLMWLAFHLFSRDMEYACDERCVRDLSREERADYAEALLACSRMSGGAVPFPSFGKVGVKSRIKAVLAQKKASKLWIGVFALLVLALGALLLTDPFPKAKGPEVPEHYEALYALLGEDRMTVLEKLKLTEDDLTDYAGTYLLTPFTDHFQGVEYQVLLLFDRNTDWLCNFAYLTQWDNAEQAAGDVVKLAGALTETYGEAQNNNGQKHLAEFSKEEMTEALKKAAAKNSDVRTDAWTLEVRTDERAKAYAEQARKLRPDRKFYMGDSVNCTMTMRVWALEDGTVGTLLTVFLDYL